MDFSDRFEPKAAVKHLVNICGIPHTSGHEEGVRGYIKDFALKQACEYFEDECGNLIVYVAASPGCEDAAPYLIQAHMDMVAAKEEWSEHNFLTDPIKLKLTDGRYLHADGTTLGADNAVGMMYMLALMEDDTVIHPPLELLFTVREETGLEGIREVDFSKIKSRRMMNMDCGDPDVMCVSTAGAAQCLVKLPLRKTALTGETMEIVLGGLLGGHGGLMIDSGRLSAVTGMGMILSRMEKKVKFSITDAVCGRFSGIAQEMKVKIAVAPEDAETAKKAVSEIEKELKNEYEDPETGLFVSIEKYSGTPYTEMLDEECSKNFIRLLWLMPSGVTKRDWREKETVICSNNTVEVTLGDGLMTMEMMTRSPEDGIKEETVDRIKAIACLCGAETEVLDSFSGWPYRSDSALQKLCREAYKELTGNELKAEKHNSCAETGVIAGFIPDMDCIAMAPLSRGAHTPKEYLDMDTVEPFWNFLVLLLEKLCRG